MLEFPPWVFFPFSMCTTFSHLFFNILFDSINHSHVHTYISCWGPEEQSPSLEINFDSTNLVCLYPAHLARGGIHLMKEVETGVGGITVCYGICLWSLVSGVRAYHHDPITFCISFSI